MTEWKKSSDLVGYEDAVSFMDERVDSIRHEGAEDLVWLLEHPSLYTGGTSAQAEDLLSAEFPVYKTGRGGEYTYHGPGQRVGYVCMNLKKQQQAPDLKKYIYDLEEWVIRALATFDIAGERRTGRVGIWVVTDQGEKKIAAIGVRIRHWITLHGVAINVNPDLSHFGGIVPCGIKEHGVTSLCELLGRDVAMAELDAALEDVWAGVFGA